MRFTDDVIFRSGKLGLFQLVILLRFLEEMGHATRDLRGADLDADGDLRDDEVTVIVHDPLASNLPRALASDVLRNVFRTATADEFARDQRLCGRRPASYCYDE